MSRTHRKCSICGFEFPTGTAGHNAKNSPMKNMQCRSMTPSDSAFHKWAPRMYGNCSHASTCNRCGLKGHAINTQNYNPVRYRRKDGKMTRAGYKKPLSVDDFVCPLVKQSDVQQLVKKLLATRRLWPRKRRVKVTLHPTCEPTCTCPT